MAACASVLGVLQGEGTEKTVGCHSLEEKFKVDKCIFNNEKEVGARCSCTVIEILGILISG